MRQTGREARRSGASQRKTAGKKPRRTTRPAHRRKRRARPGERRRIRACRAIPVIIAPGGVRPGGEPSGGVRPGQNMSGNVYPGQDAAESVRPGQDQPTQGRVEFYGPPGT